MIKPVIILGQGIRGNPELVKHLQSLNIPCLYTWMAADMGIEDSPTYCGRPGIFGQRAANIIQQKATHLYCFGARLDGEQVAYAYDRFAPNAEIYVNDIDEAEWRKFPERYSCGFGELLPKMGNPEWLAWCRALYNRFRPELDGKSSQWKYIDPFYFLTKLHEYSNPDDVFAIGSSGNAPTTFFQSYKVKKGQRVSNVCTIGAMGADIPMALGAALATGRRVICPTGDGGFAMNAQELETIRRLHLPIVFFVMNNGGYNSIRVGQKMRFDGRVMGCTPETGLTLPPIEDIAHAYRMMYLKLDSEMSLIPKCFEAAPMVVEVPIDPEWEELPRVMASGSGANLRTDDMQDMTPKLDPEELERIMNE